MIKYIKTFSQTDFSEVNIPLIKKDWNERFSIAFWSNGKDCKYRLIIKSKRKEKLLLKTQISDCQAIELIEVLDLVNVKSDIFKSASSFVSEDFVCLEIERLEELLYQTNERVVTLNNNIHLLRQSLDNSK